MSDFKLAASARTAFGKGAARQARRDGQVPAVIYSQGSAATHILLDGHETFLTVKNHRTSLISLDLDGDIKTVIIKDVQRDPIGRVIEHIDFISVERGDTTIVEVPVVLIGEPEPGTQTTLELLKISVEADVSVLPEHVEVSVDGLTAGTVLHVKDAVLPAGQKITNDPEQVLLVVNEVHNNEDDADASAE